jgi:hypothetical protein
MDDGEFFPSGWKPLDHPRDCGCVVSTTPESAKLVRTHATARSVASKMSKTKLMPLVSSGAMLAAVSALTCVPGGNARTSKTPTQKNSEDLLEHNAGIACVLQYSKGDALRQVLLLLVHYDLPLWLSLLCLSLLCLSLLCLSVLCLSLLCLSVLCLAVLCLSVLCPSMLDSTFSISQL